MSGFTERARPHKVPTPIITNLDLVLHQPAMTTAPVLAPVVRQPSVVEMNRARRLARFNRITTALQTGNIALIEGLFEEMNVTIKESPTHAPNPGQPRRRLVGFLFLDTTPAARLAPAGDVTPRTPQSSSEMKEAANLICAYLKRSLSPVEKLQFIELIKHSNAEFFSTLFFPFITNRKELYSLVEANGVDQIIKHIPIDELSKFINCLAGPGPQFQESCRL